MAKDLFTLALEQEGVSGSLAQVARSIYQQESGGGKNTKTTNAGAVGGMQIIPSTFASVADKGWDINDPLLNARAGIRYLKQLDKQSGGDPALTAAGYYGGPGGMEKARKGIAVHDPRNPNAPSTLEYGRQVAARLPGKTHPADPLPVVLAHAAEEVPVDDVPQVQAQEAIPVQLAAQAQAAPTVPVDWEQFRTYTPQRPVVAEDLQYAPASVGAPRIAYAGQHIVPNLVAFQGWKGKLG